MRKLISLLIIPVLSTVIFLTAHTPVKAACSFTITSTTPVSAGGEITVQITPDVAPTDYTALILFVDDEGNTHLTPSIKSERLIAPARDTITLSVPNTPGNYEIGVWRGSEAGPDTSPDPICGENQSFVIQTDVSSCEGFLGCLGSVSTPELNFSDPATFIGDLITELLPIILGIIGFITVIVIVISGIQFITSSGNPEAAAAARSRLTFAIIGFVIVILAFAITQIIDTIFLGGSGVF